MNKKAIKIILVVFAIAMLSLGLIYYFFSDRFHPVERETLPVETASNAREVASYSGDDGYVLKGRLLDEGQRKTYDQLPDTLARLRFGEQLYVVTVNENANPTYSLFSKPVTAREIDADGILNNKNWELLVQFLRLAEAGKANFPRVVSLRPSADAMMSLDAFNEKYGQYFSSPFADEIPYLMKNKLLEFFKSDDGKDFTFISNDQRVHSELIRYGNFTGRERQDVALVLERKNEFDGGTNEKLLVLSYDLAGAVYVLYQENFYDKILIETVYHDPEERWDDRIYMNTEEKHKAPYEAIRVKIPDSKDVALVYNKEFDKMNRYIQSPLSVLKADQEHDEQ